MSSLPSGIRLMNLLRDHLTEIMDRERANLNSIHLYCTGSYWVSFERSAYQLRRVFLDSETYKLLTVPGLPMADYHVWHAGEVEGLPQLT